jgi:Flp pilus assembly protein TadD
MLIRSRRLTFAALALVMLYALACSGNKPKEGPATSTESPVSAATPTAPVPTAEAGPTSVAVVNPSFEEARVAFTAGRYPEAVTLFTGYTSNHPHNPWGYYMLGLSAWKAGDLAGAESAFNTALQLEPTHQKSLFNSSRVLLEEGKTDEALARIEQAINQDPTSGEGYRLLGRARYQLGQVEPAIEAYQQALVLDQTDVWAMNNLGLIYIQQGRYEEALPPLARAVELRSGSTTFQNNLGVALERSGQFIAAAQAYEAALSADSGNKKASVALARVRGLPEVEGTAPADLAQLSQSFRDQVEGWRTVTSDSSGTGTAQPDSTGSPGVVARQGDGSNNPQ